MNISWRSIALERVMLSLLTLACALLCVVCYLQNKTVQEIDAALVSQIARVDSIEARQYIFLRPLVQMHAQFFQQQPPPLPIIPNLNPTRRSN